MNNFLLSRALGSVSHQSLAKAQNARLLHSISPADHIKFTYKDKDDDPVSHNGADEDDNKVRDTAHPAGVNSVVIDKFEGR